MKISKTLLFAYCLAVIIFFIPFGWLKPGEMDLGGDNSRLYFYDPIAYMTSQSLFGISHSGFGGENVSYFAIPFFLLLAFVKSLVHSPTILISIFHGLNLSLGFLFCFLIVRELLIVDEKLPEGVKNNLFVRESASILAGLYYTFSPNPIRWWGFPLLPMNVVFLNPLLFYLLLRFFLTHSSRYLYIALVVTFIFSANFSFIGAPTFFSFFPLAGIFLYCYVRYVLHRAIPFKKLLYGIILFLLIQSFHLLPQIVSILTPGTAVHSFIFDNQGKLQWGLKYFLATAPSIKVSYALLGLPQYTEPEIHWAFYMIFPLMIVLATLWNKSKLYLLNLFFFLITLYFVSANITQIGVTLYALAFRLPGFSMFRVYYGQWEWAYLFFYTVLVGQAIATVLSKLTSKRQHLVIGSAAVLLIVTSIPLVTGKMTDTILWQSKKIHSHVKMDPRYEEALAYIKKLPIDGKIISFPLNDHGYQAVKGANDAAYVGPSTITYIAARNEFNGVVEFDTFAPSLLAAARDGDVDTFRDILSILNIRYIFYNEDPYIYVDNFPGIPYTDVRKYFPGTQEGYKEFIQTLAVKEVKSFEGGYHIYEFDDSSYVPHLYTAKNISFWSGNITDDPHIPISFYPDDKRVAFVDNPLVYSAVKNIFDEVFLKARNASTIFDFFKKKDIVRFVSPTVTRAPSSFLYPLVVLKEKRDLRKYKTVDDAFIDRNIYFAEKRINELSTFKNIPVRGGVTSISLLAKNWKDPSLLDFAHYKDYNSWEVTLARYEGAMERLIGSIEDSKNTSYASITSKVDLKNYFRDHKSKLRTAIRDESSLSLEDKKYLSNLVEGMFIDLYHALNLTLPDFNNIPFVVEAVVQSGLYEVYVNKNDMQNINFRLSSEGNNLQYKPTNLNEWTRFDDIPLQSGKSLSMLLSIDALPNLAAKSNWILSEQMLSDSRAVSTSDSAMLSIKDAYLNDTSGLVRDIPGWERNAMYSVSFDYLTHDQNFSVVLYEKGGADINRYVSNAYDETIRSKDWRKFSIAVQSARDADAAFIQITKALDDVVDSKGGSDKKIEVKNVVVQKIYNPTVVVKLRQHPLDPVNPHITVSQLSPTRYKVDVQNATSPYTLVLSQTFNQKWKLFQLDSGKTGTTLKALGMRGIGSLLATWTKFILPYPKEKESAFSKRYPTYGIDERAPKSIFWSQDAFETWGMKPIAENTHVLINGYANAWYITPQDTGSATNYTFIVEMTQQNLFIVSLLVSALTFGLVIVLLVASIAKKHT